MRRCHGRGTTPVLAVHSRPDEVVPVGPTERRIKEWKAQAVNAELACGGLTHDQADRFVDPRKGCLPWLRGVWT